MNFICNYNPDFVWKEACPLKKCWAWISPQQHSTCCLFQQTQKKTLGIADLALFYHQSFPSLKKEIKTAYQDLQLGLALAEGLENGLQPATVCPDCGRPGLLCCNQRKCQARRNFYRVQQKRDLLQTVLQVENWQLYQLFRQKPVQRLLETWLQETAWIDLFR